MNRIAATAAALVLLCATSACQEKAAEAPAAAMLSEADAAAAADEYQAASVSMDVPRIESVYAKNVVHFSPITPALGTDWDTFDKRIRDFAALKFDNMEVADRKIQVLDDNVFVVSGTAKQTSTDGPTKERTVRFTNVYQKQGDGSWKIVTAHRSFPPEEPAA